MRGKSIAKKITCTVVKTSLGHSNTDMPVSMPWDDQRHFKPAVPIAGINPSKHFKDMTGKPVERRLRSRFFDYYA
jgi:hypothetical protein